MCNFLTDRSSARNNLRQAEFNFPVNKFESCQSGIRTKTYHFFALEFVYSHYKQKEQQASYILLSPNLLGKWMSSNILIMVSGVLW